MTSLSVGRKTQNWNKVDACVYLACVIHVPLPIILCIVCRRRSTQPEHWRQGSSKQKEETHHHPITNSCRYCCLSRSEKVEPHGSWGSRQIVLRSATARADRLNFNFVPILFSTNYVLIIHIIYVNILCTNYVLIIHIMYVNILCTNYVLIIHIMYVYML